MTIDNQIRDKKLHYDGINREAAKISGLSSGKINEYEYLTGEKILPSNQKQITEQAKFTHSHLGKAFEKQTKIIEIKKKNQISAIEEHVKQIIESNKVAKILILIEVVCQMKNKKKHLIDLQKKVLINFLI